MTWGRPTVVAREIHARPVAQIVEDVLDRINAEQPGLLLELLLSAKEFQDLVAGTGPDDWSEDALAAAGWESVRDEVWGAVCGYLGQKSESAVG